MTQTNLIDFGIPLVFDKQFKMEKEINLESRILEIQSENTKKLEKEFENDIKISVRSNKKNKDYEYLMNLVGA